MSPILRYNSVTDTFSSSSKFSQLSVTSPDSYCLWNGMDLCILGFSFMIAEVRKLLPFVFRPLLPLPRHSLLAIHDFLELSLHLVGLVAFRVPGGTSSRGLLHNGVELNLLQELEGTGVVDLLVLKK
jgi:hypothetical protein